MRHKIFTLVMALVASTLVFAANIQSGKIGPTATWNYNPETKEFRISGTGSTYNGSYSYNGMFIAAPKKAKSATEASPYGAISFSYGAKLKGDAYTFNTQDVKSIVVEEGITELGEWTCAFFHNAESVQLPNSLTTLGGGAFLEDTSLTVVTVPQNVNTMQVATCVSQNHMAGDDIDYGAFSGCTHLTTVNWNASGSEYIIRPLYGLETVLTNLVLGTTVTYLPEKFCSGFKKISGELVLAKNIRNIGYRAFYGCTGITKITVLSDSIDTPPTLFQNDYYTQSQYFNYQGSPFANGAENLEVVIGKGVKYIGDFMFSAYYRQGKMVGASGTPTYTIYHGSMGKVHFSFEEGSTLEGVGTYAFAGATGFGKLVLPESIKEIWDYAFYNTDVTELVIPKDIWSIGTNAFSSCSSLSVIRLNAESMYVSYDSSEKDVVFRSPFVNCADSITVYIGKEVTTLSQCLFMGGKYTGKEKNDEWIYTPSISTRTDVRNVILEEGSKLASIEDCVFAGCVNITKMTIPEHVYQILDYSFAGCTGIDTFHVEMDSPSTLGTTSFPANAKIKVKCDARQTYLNNEEWNKYNIVTECIGENLPPQQDTYYTIRFLDWNGAVLQNTQVKEGDMPAYTGVTPTRAEDEQYTYTFKGWSPTITTATADADYTAQYTATAKPVVPKSITVRLHPDNAWATVYLYAWTDKDGQVTQVSDNWPGTKVSKDAEGWWSYTFAEDIKDVNIVWGNGGQGLSQTIDILHVTQSTCYTLDGSKDNKANVVVIGCDTPISNQGAKVPTPEDLTKAGYDLTNNVVVCLHFVLEATVCYDIVLAGTYNNWSTTPADMLKLQELAGFNGWYIAQFPYTFSKNEKDEPIYPQAKPVQLKSDGSFSWENQSGEPAAWTHIGGKGAYVVAGGMDHEADVYYPEAGAYIYELSYWKKHMSPCVITPKHNYTIKLYAPDACDQMKPAIIGAFNNWSKNIPMTAQTDNEQKTYYTYTVYTEEGTEYKFREVNDSTWENQIQIYNTINNTWINMSNLILPVTNEDEYTVTYDYSDNTLYRFTLCNVDDLSGIDNALTPATDAPRKVLMNGVLYILRDEKVYTIQGQKVR